MIDCDLVVIGGGMFGVYASLHFQRLGKKVLLLEQQPEAEVWTKASLVNQARVHSGHHYPRSFVTASLSLEHRDRFVSDHRFAIREDYKSLYAIDRFGSEISASQFLSYCRKLDLPVEEIEPPAVIRGDRLEAVFEVEEVTFDPFLLRAHYLEQLRLSSVSVVYGVQALEGVKDGESWRVSFLDVSGVERFVATPAVVNATYASSNVVSRAFGLGESKILSQISEVALVHSPDLANLSLTVMDGQFLSFMPFGKTGLTSLTSVPYTHHEVSREPLPTFSCQLKNRACTPESLSSCTRCPVRPPSNLTKMIAQLRMYIRANVEITPHGSLFTVKATSNSAENDERMTTIRVISRKPTFVSLFSGKINSIYEIEKVVL